MTKTLKPIGSTDQFLHKNYLQNVKDT